MEREINGYIIKTLGGFIMVKHWVVTRKENDSYQGTFFKFGTAKDACLKENFQDAYLGRMY